MMVNHSTLPGFIIVLISILFMGCGSAKMAKEGYYTADVDKYFNKREQLNIWLYYHIRPYESGSTGLRKDNLYPMDRAMLKKLKLLKSGNKIMFSAIPELDPKYNLIAIKHNNRKINLGGYEQKTFENAIYFEKNYSEGGMAIKHAYIPYGEQEGLSLVYYIVESEDRKCPFCKFDYLTQINARELSKGSFQQVWETSLCTEGKALKSIPLRLDLLKKHKNVFLEVYEINPSADLVCYVRALDKNDPNSIQINLCRGDYKAYFTDENKVILDSLHFHH